MRAVRFVLFFGVMAAVDASVARGQDSQPASGSAAGGRVETAAPAGAEAPASQPAKAAMPSLIQTLPDYSGDIWTRSFMLGDWGGARTELAEHGILFDLDVTQYLQGNAHGGKNTQGALEYGGSVDYRLRLDTARMGLWPGGLITLHGETQFGRAVNGNAGAIMPANYEMLLPVPGDPGVTTLSEFYLMQALSEKLVLLAGKIDLTALGDRNDFAGDATHVTQFQNTAFNINPVLFNGGPYTALAAGVILLPTDWLQISTIVLDNDPDGAATKTGFNTAFHDRTWLSVCQEYDFTIKPFGQTGHQRFGWFWTSRDFTEFGQDSRLELPVTLRRRGRSLLRFLRSGFEKKPDDWGLYYNFDQHLYTEADDPEQGWGVFGRFGWSTGESNLVEEFYSIGLGGKGTIPRRDRDTWGVGYYLVNFSDDIDADDIDSEQGVELFYNIEVTPWLHITPDVQVIVDPGGGFGDRDVALVYGIRAQMSF